VEVLLDAKKQGKARFIGVSTHRGQVEVIPALIKNGQFDAVMVTYNFAMDNAKTLPPIQSARQAGLGVIGMKALAGSFRLDPASYDRAKAAMKQPGAALAALKWALRGDLMDTVIPSMVDMDQLAENVRAMAESFGEADGKLLAGYLDRFGPVYCRMCGACEGACPKGLPVSDMQRVLAYLDGYRQFPLARERFLRLPERAQRTACDCSVCTVECAFGVDVARRVRRAQELLA